MHHPESSLRNIDELNGQVITPSQSESRIFTGLIPNLTLNGATVAHPEQRIIIKDVFQKMLTLHHSADGGKEVQTFTLLELRTMFRNVNAAKPWMEPCMLPVASAGS